MHPIRRQYVLRSSTTTVVVVLLSVRQQDGKLTVLEYKYHVM